MTKLKTLLEGFAWERKADGSLPTLQDAINTHKANMSEPEDVSEESNPVKAKIAKLEKELADVKHQYYKDSNLSTEREDQLRKKIGDLGRELKGAKREDKTGSAGYGKPSKSKDVKPDYIDADGDGNEEESMKKAFQDKKEMHESFIGRMKKNLIGGATRK
jgi:hypothetical protein